MYSDKPSPQRLDYLRQRRRRKNSILIFQLLVLIVFFVQWELTARNGLVDAFIVSSPSRMLATLQNLWSSGDIWVHLGVSCLETTVGFLLGTVLGTVIAIALWWSDYLSKILEPYLVVLNALPKTALGPIFIVWMGAGVGSIIAMTLAISIIVTILNMHVGFLSTDREKIRLMCTFGASKWQILWKHKLP